jgi:hypothetical protein
MQRRIGNRARLGVQLIRMHVPQRPVADRVALGCNHFDCRCQAHVRSEPGTVPAVEPTQRVAIVAGGEQELRSGWVDHRAS